MMMMMMIMMIMMIMIIIMIMMNDDDNHQMFDHLPKSMLRLEPTTTRRTKHCLILYGDQNYD